MQTQTGISEPARRQHDRSFKAALVEQSLQPGASVAGIALDNGINANLLFKWHRQHQRKQAAELASAVLLPVRVVQAADVKPSGERVRAAPRAPAPTMRDVHAGLIELEIAGARLRLRGAVDELSLCSVLRALRQST